MASIVVPPPEILAQPLKKKKNGVNKTVGGKGRRTVGTFCPRKGGKGGGGGEIEEKEKEKTRLGCFYMFRSEGRRFENTCSEVDSRYKRCDRANLPLESTGEVESGLPLA